MTTTAQALGLLGLLQDPHAEARAFYGDWTFNAIAEWERKNREEMALRAKVAPDLIDDVASQIDRRK